MATDRLSQHDDAEPPHAASPTARLLDEMQLYGHRPYQDDPDPRPLPDAKRSASPGVSWTRRRASRASAPKRRRSALKSFVTGLRMRASVPAALARLRRRIAA